MTLFEKNRNDLSKSKYCYDLSKAILISMIAVPVFKKELDLLSITVGSVASALFLFLGMILKGEK